MEIKFIGTGGAFDYEYLNSSALVEVQGKNILIDCGHSIFPALRKLNKSDAMDYVVITHLHDDHVGSLSSLLAYSLHFNKKKLTVLYPNDDFLDDLIGFLNYTLHDPYKYGNFQQLDEIEGISFISTYGLHVKDLHTFAYYFEEDDERIAYSGDLADCEALFQVLDQLPAKKTTVFHDITFNPDNQAHCYYKKLEPYTDRYRIFGYHCDPRLNPKDNSIALVYRVL